MLSLPFNLLRKINSTYSYSIAFLYGSDAVLKKAKRYTISLSKKKRKKGVNNLERCKHKNWSRLNFRVCLVHCMRPVRVRTGAGTHLFGWLSLPTWCA
jgi:hypothetical protein